MASSFPVQDPGDVLAFAGASGTLVRKALQSQQDPCIEDFPTGSDVNGTSLNDLQVDCEGAKLAGKSWSRVFAALAAKWGARVVVTVGTTVGYLVATEQPVTDQAQDTDFLQRVNDFISKRQRAQSADYYADPDVRQEVETIIDQCDSINISVSDCDTMPIYAPGQDIAEAAYHDFDAI